MRLLTLAMLSLVVPALLAQGSDSFDDFDKMLDQQFEQADSVINARYDAVDKAVDRAFQGLTRKIEVHWGENTRMPERERWVTYSKGMETRLSLDFKRSEMVIEQVLPADADIGEELNKLGNFAVDLMHSTAQELNASDSLVNEIQSELAAANVKTESGTLAATNSESKENVIGKVVHLEEVEKALAEMARLGEDVVFSTVSPAPEPQIEKPATVSKSVPSIAIEQIEKTAAVPRSDPGVAIEQIAKTAAVPRSDPGVAIEQIAKPAVESKSAPSVAIEQNGAVKILKVSFPFVSNAQKNIMQEYMDEVRQYSAEYDIPVSVILAIIETESSFNPRAVSPIPAFGLMQLVPRTAGVDAYHRVHGEKKVVEPKFLFDETNNIQLGAAYLHVVRDRYLRKIKNPYSRFYCAIAAYNTGVGNVAKTMSGTTSLNAAARRVNQMTEEEVFAHLLENLPAEETRNYLRKIIARIENYKHLDMG